MKNTDKKNNELRKRSWLNETVFHKIASVMFYEKSFRKRFLNVNTLEPITEGRTSPQESAKVEHGF